MKTSSKHFQVRSNSIEMDDDNKEAFITKVVSFQPTDMTTFCVAHNLFIDQFFGDFETLGL